MILYHASNIMFEKIDLEKSKEFRDFGKAFYLATEYFDALSLIKKNKGGFLYTFELNEKDLKGLTISEFAGKTLDWSDFIWNCKHIKNFNKNDLTIGYTAGGDIQSYLNEHKDISTYNKYEFLITISNTNLGIQYAFLTPEAIKKLKLVSIKTFHKEDFD